MAGYNVHAHNLNINIVPKYTEEYVSVVNGAGETLIPEFYEQGTATFEGTTEDITILNKEFVISDTGYSGVVTIKYYAKDMCRLFLFSLIASGVTQVQTFLAKIYIKVFGSSVSSTTKYSKSTIYVKEKSSKWNCLMLKNILSSISLNLNIAGRISSIKKTFSNIDFDFLISDYVPIIKTMLSHFFITLDGSADVTVARYRPLSEFSENTLESLLTSTLEEMIYTVI